MKKSTLLYLLVVILGLLSLLMTVSSFMLWVVFPRGFYGVRVLWADIHKWGGLALGVGVLLHVLLHWKWLVRKTRRYLSRTSRRAVESGTPQGEIKGAQPELN